MELENKSYFSLAQCLYILASAVVVFFVSVTTIEINWDALGYAGVAYERYYEDDQALHAAVYQDLASTVSQVDYERLTASSSYRSTTAADPEAFIQQLPYYKIRLLHSYAIQALHAMGVNVFHAAVYVSAFFAALGLLVAYVVFGRWMDAGMVYLIPFVFYLSDGLVLGKTVSADSMAFVAMLMVIGFYLMQSRLLFFALVLCVLIRTDLLLLCGSVVGLQFLKKPDMRVHCIVAFIAVVLIYMWIGSYAGNYGWRVLIEFVFATDLKLAYPADVVDISWRFDDYIGFLFSGLLVNSAIVGTIIFSAIAYFTFIHPAGLWNFKANYLRWLADVNLLDVWLISMAYIAAHYLFFPVLLSRFFAGYYFVIACIALIGLSQLKRLSTIQRDSYLSRPKKNAVG